MSRKGNALKAKRAKERTAKLKAQNKQLKDMQSQIKELESANEALQARLEEAEVKASGSVEKAPKTEVKVPKTNQQPGPALDQRFRDVWKELNVDREFPRIPDMRKQLNLPRDVFDAEIKRLRNSMTVQIYLADESTMTQEEIRNCFVDENGFRMGTMTWSK